MSSVGSGSYGLAMSDSTTIEVERSSLDSTRTVEATASPLGQDQVRLRIDRFAITANNVTYAVVGDMFGYWSFYPTEDPTWGRVPMMGFAEIVESNHAELAVGDRYYGWYPMSDEVTIRARTSSAGFMDISDHREGQAPVYRSFSKSEIDADGDELIELEERHSLLRGLFLTSFLAEAFFADNGGADGPTFFGADRAIVTSASSKTSIAFAQRAAARGVPVVGVTSPGNAEFVKSIEWYDSVVTYDDLAAVGSEDKAVIYDIAGNAQVLADLHEVLGDSLTYSMRVGMAHHDAGTPDGDRPLAGPEPIFFMAPFEVERRRDDWGAAEFEAQTAAALDEFIEGSTTWLDLERHEGVEAVTGAWQRMVSGESGPTSGVIGSIRA